MSFDIDVGHHSEAGPRQVNEDFAAALRAPAGDESRGLIAALADGVSSGGGGLEAAQTSVRSVLEDYFGAPDTWDTTVVLDRLIGAQNAWLADHNRRRSEFADASVAMTTLTVLVLRGHGFTLAHVGDARAYLLRGASGELSQLTQDHHLHQSAAMRAPLTRALGLDDRVRVDYLQGEVHRDDRFVLVSDGVHGRLERKRIAAIAGDGDAQAASVALVRASLERGADDNATALVLHVRGLAASELEDSLVAGRTLPVPPPLSIGTVLDGHTITALVANNGLHRVYQAREARSGDLVLIKTLHESRASDREERSMLVHEAWLGRRVTQGALPQGEASFVRLRETSTPTAFYAAFDWHAGRTLEQRLAAGQAFQVGEIVDGITAVVRGLGRLHRHGVIHRDLKPANLLLGDDGRWRILDLGVAVSGREPKALRTLHAGTPSYMNPEQWRRDSHHPADRGSDLFALGVVVYQWLTGRLPYGDVEPYQAGAFRRDPKPPSRLRPDVPIWLDRVVLKAVALDVKQRFETAEEMALALQRGASRPLSPPPATPLSTRDPMMLWKLGLGVSVLLNLLLIYWLAALPH
jgi:serine/threonine protein phosphatase PrpC